MLYENGDEEIMCAEWVFMLFKVYVGGTCEGVYIISAFL